MLSISFDKDTVLQHTEEIVNSLQAVLNRALTHSLDENMRSIKGLSDRFSGLERLLKEVRTLLQEQGDLAKVRDCSHYKDFLFTIFCRSGCIKFMKCVMI